MVVVAAGGVELRRLSCDCYGGCWGAHARDRGWPALPHSEGLVRLAVARLPHGSYVWSREEGTLWVGAQSEADASAALGVDWQWYCERCRCGALGLPEPPEPVCHGCGGPREVEIRDCGSDQPAFEPWWVGA